MSARSDKLHQRKKRLSKAGLRRNEQTKTPNMRILIVCEGEVTEPNYFEAFKSYFKLSNVDIDICGKECGSAPISVVEYAEKKANAEGHYKSGGYDEVFCVFDRDEHPSFEKAVSKIYSLNKSTKFLAKKIKPVISYPCFEIWLLFHFNYTRAPFVRSGENSPADMVALALKSTSLSFSDYNKSLTGDQCLTLLRLFDDAKANSEKALNDCHQTSELNPSTQIHGMLGELLAAKNSN